MTPAQAWPAVLDAALPNQSVVNLGRSGWALDEIAVLVGAIKLPITAASGAIPASGAVTVTTSATVGWVPGIARSYPGTLAGIPGTLTRSSTGVLTFTRTATGSDVSLPAGTLFVSASDGHAADTMILFAGRNDVAYGVIGGEANTLEHIVAGTQRIVNYLTPTVARFILVGTINSTADVRGTDRWGTITTANARLAALYPMQFHDLRAYIVNRAIYDAGISPTAADLANIAADAPPVSIMQAGDIIHYTAPIHALVGAWMLARLTSKEWTR